MSENAYAPKGRKGLRRTLMIGGVTAVLLGSAAAWLSSGRYASTDNAYIQSDIVMISPQVTGPIVESKLDDNMTVKQGDILFRIDPSQYQIALAQSEANLVTARTTVEKMKADYMQQQASLQSAQADVTYRTELYNRYMKLKNTNAISKSDIDEVTRNLANARESLSMIQQAQAGVLAQLAGNPNIAIEDHPAYKAAVAARDKAKLDLDHTTVYAPFSGVVSGVPKTGDYARASAPSLSIVNTGRVWVDANFKETQLTQMKVGQPVTIDVDTYPGHAWKGRVESISPATGSEFSILPAQNSTGNWVKVVQRIAVRIAVTPEPAAPPLRAGMSTEVSVDTGHYPHLPTAMAGDR